MALWSVIVVALWVTSTICNPTTERYHEVVDEAVDPAVPFKHLSTLQRRTTNPGSSTHGADLPKFITEHKEYHYGQTFGQCLCKKTVEVREVHPNHL